MRFLIVNTDYRGFTRWLCARHPGLERRSYDEQMKIRDEALFGVADFYSQDLRRLGHEAYDIRANNECMQKARAREHGVRLSSGRSLRFRLRRGVVPWVGLARNQKWMYEILAAPLPPSRDFAAYDLMISSLPNLVCYFRQQRLCSELHRMGFGHRVLERLGKPREPVGVSFVGGPSRSHGSRRRWLEHVRQRVDDEIWGHGAAGLPQSSPIGRNCRGPAWGFEMHQILRSSRIALNHHIDAAESYADNMRLYEATGVDDPCEPPAGPDIGVRAVGGSPEDGARKIVEELVVRGSLPEEGRERGLGTA